MLGASIRLFNRRIFKGETQDVDIRARELGAVFFVFFRAPFDSSHSCLGRGVVFTRVF